MYMYMYMYAKIEHDDAIDIDSRACLLDPNRGISHSAESGGNVFPFRGMENDSAEWVDTMTKAKNLIIPWFGQKPITKPKNGGRLRATSPFGHSSFASAGANSHCHRQLT